MRSNKDLKISFDAIRKNAPDILSLIIEKSKSHETLNNFLNKITNDSKTLNHLLTSIGHIIEFYSDDDHLVKYIKDRRIQFQSINENINFNMNDIDLLTQNFLEVMHYCFDDQWTVENDTSWLMLAEFVASKISIPLANEDKLKLASPVLTTNEIQEISDEKLRKMFEEYLNKEGRQLIEQLISKMLTA